MSNILAYGFIKFITCKREHFDLPPRIRPISFKKKFNYEEKGDEYLDLWSPIIPRRTLWTRNDKSYYAQLIPDSKPNVIQTAKKISFAVLCTPLFLAGIVLKLISFRDKDLKEYYQVPSQSLNSPEFLDRVIENPKDFSPFIGPFSECPCVRSGNFNRLKTTRRENIEKNMLETVTTSFPTETTNKLNYMSLGSGGLLQDIVNVGKLIKAGYKSISVNLITHKMDEIKNYQYPNEELFKAILKEYAKKYNVEIEVQEAFTIEEWTKKYPTAKMDVISAVDFDDLLRKGNEKVIFSTQKTLSEKGTMFLSYDHTNYAIGTEGIKKIDFANQHDVISPIVEVFKEESLKYLNKNKKTSDQISITCHGIQSFSQFDCQVLGHIAKNGYENIHLNLISANSDMTTDQQFIENMIKLFNPNATVTVDVIQSENFYIQQAKNSEIKQDIYMNFNFFGRSEDDLKDKLKLFKQFSHHGVFYLNLGKIRCQLERGNLSILNSASEDTSEVLSFFNRL